MSAAVCAGAGARLCTVEEILNDETQGTGCGHDGDQVWTSSQCIVPGTGVDGVDAVLGIWSAQGNANGSPVCNTDLTLGIATRCCADTVVDANNMCAACK